MSKKDDELIKALANTCLALEKQVNRYLEQRNTYARELEIVYEKLNISDDDQITYRRLAHTT